VRVFFTKKMLQPFDADDVRVAHALQPQHNEFDSLRFNPLLQRVEISVELRRGAEEQFSLAVVDKEPWIDGCIRRQTLAHDTLGRDDQLRALQLGRAGTKEQDR
jgi:hypothetical protein